MPPKPTRSLSVSKQCDECGGPNPVACKSCTACGADFYNSSLDKSDSPGDPNGDLVSDTPSTPGSERRRSERVRREKPDYYDALDFDTKRRNEKFPAGTGPSTPSRLRRSDKIPYKSPRISRNADGVSTPQRGRPRKWKKGLDDEDYDQVRNKRKKKKKHLLKNGRSEEHTSESSHITISYAVFCLKKKNKKYKNSHYLNTTILVHK